LKNLIRTRKVVGITGGSGVLGKFFIEKYKNIFNFKMFQGDITNYKVLKRWYIESKPDYFLHFAAKVPVKFVEKNYKKSKKINVGGVSNIIKIIENDKNLLWFFLASTSHVYKKTNFPLSENSRTVPANKYGKTKLFAENKLKKIYKKKTICIGRIFSFTDKSQSKDFVIPSIFKKIKESRNKKFIINEATRDFIHIDDICSAIYFLLRNNAKGIYNIGTGHISKITDVIKFFSKRLKKKISIILKKNKVSDVLISNNNKIKSLGWYPKKSFLDILNDYYLSNR
jgi:nucleoside-diphosphate-sugar epimerase